MGPEQRVLRGIRQADEVEGVNGADPPRRCEPVVENGSRLFDGCQLTAGKGLGVGLGEDVDRLHGGTPLGGMRPVSRQATAVGPKRQRTCGGVTVVSA